MKFAKRVIKIQLEKAGNALYTPEITRKGEPENLTPYILGYEPNVEFPHGFRFVVHHNHYRKRDQKWKATEIITGLEMSTGWEFKESAVEQTLEILNKLNDDEVANLKEMQISNELNAVDGFAIPKFKSVSLKIYLRDVSNETSKIKEVKAYRPVDAEFPLGLDLLIYRPLVWNGDGCKVIWTVAQCPSGRCLKYHLPDDLVGLKAHDYHDTDGDVSFGWSDWYLTQETEGWEEFRHQHRELLYFEVKDYLERFVAFHGEARLQELLKKIERIKRK